MSFLANNEVGPFQFWDNLISDPNSNPTRGTFSSFSQFFGIAINIVLGTAFTLSILGIILAGIKFVMSAGDPKQIDTAKRYLTAAVVAVVLSLGVFIVKTVILNILGSSEGSLTNVLPTF